MSARNTVVRTMHDLGLAARFGGTLMPEARGNTKVKSVVTVLGAAAEEAAEDAVVGEEEEEA